MAFSSLLLPPRGPPRLPPPRSPTTHGALLSSTCSPTRLRTFLPQIPRNLKAAVATCGNTSTNISFFNTREGRSLPWKTSCSTRPTHLQRPSTPATNGSEGGEVPANSPTAPQPATLFRAGDLLRATWPGFWLQVCIALLSRVLLWAIRRPLGPGFPRPVVAAWVLLGLWRAVSANTTGGLIPLGELPARVTKNPDLGPTAFSATAVGLLLTAMGAFFAMDQLAAWAISEVVRRELKAEAAMVAFWLWSLRVLAGAGDGGVGARVHAGGRGPPRWWELATWGVCGQLCVLCLCLPHHLVKCLLERWGVR